MNNTQRKRIREIQEEIEGLKSEIEQMAELENEKYENMPDNMQESEKANSMYESAALLESVTGRLDTALDELGEACL